MHSEMDFQADIIKIRTSGFTVGIVSQKEIPCKPKANNIGK